MIENETQVPEQELTEVETEVNSVPEVMIESPEDKKPDMNHVIAGIKKEFREKGFKAGYDQAKKEAEPKVSPQITQDDPSRPLTVGELQYLQFQKSSDKVYEAANLKYSDFDDKVKPILERAKSNPTLFALMRKAVELENEDALYRLATDKEFRGHLLDVSPSDWSKEILNNSKKESVKKLPPEPIEPIKSSPISSDMTNNRQKRIETLRRNGVLRT